jgi:hypothetical protein
MEKGQDFMMATHLRKNLEAMPVVRGRPGRGWFHEGCLAVGTMDSGPRVWVLMGCERVAFV